MQIEVRDCITTVGVIVAIIVFQYNIKHNRRQLKIGKLEELLTLISDLIILYEPLRKSYEVVIAQLQQQTSIGQLLAYSNYAISIEQNQIVEIAGSKEKIYEKLRRVEILTIGYVTKENLRLKIETLLELYSTFALTIFNDTSNTNIDFPIPTETEYLNFYMEVRKDILSAMQLNSKLVPKEKLSKYKSKKFQKDFTKNNNFK